MQTENMMLRVMTTALLLVLCGGTLPGFPSVKDNTTTVLVDEGEAKSLIRKDLLLRSEAEPVMAGRNIFALQAGPQGQGRVTPVPEEENPLEAGNRETGVEAKTPQPRINIRYIGYVGSPEKITALILFEGRAMAVEEGEGLRPGIQMGKVTAEQVEVIVSDSEKLVFSLEGEEE